MPVPATLENGAPIALFVYCLRSGGAERVVVRLANTLAAQGQPVIVVTELGPETDQYKLDPSVERVVVGAQRTGPAARVRAMAAKITQLRRFLQERRPAALIAFMTRGNVLALAAGIGGRTPIVIAERNDPRFRAEPLIDRLMRRLLYRRAHVAVAQTPAIEQVLRDLFGIRRTTCIPNPCEPAPAAIAPAARRRDYVLAMGRLVPAKGFDVLIRAWAQTEAARSLDLVIAGQGEQAARLAALAADGGVVDSVALVGHVADPFPLINGARCFVLSSRFEGFPNVVLEAMSCGRPVVCTRLPSGAHRMIEDGVNGLLVDPDDVAALARAIDAVVADPALGERLGAAGRGTVAQFAPDRIARQWLAAASLDWRQAA